LRSGALQSRGRSRRRCSVRSRFCEAAWSLHSGRAKRGPGCAASRPGNEASCPAVILRIAPSASRPSPARLRLASFAQFLLIRRLGARGEFRAALSHRVIEIRDHPCRSSRLYVRGAMRSRARCSSAPSPQHRLWRRHTGLAQRRQPARKSDRLRCSLRAAAHPGLSGGRLPQAYRGRVSSAPLLPRAERHRCPQMNSREWEVQGAPPPQGEGAKRRKAHSNRPRLVSRIAGKQRHTATPLGAPPRRLLRPWGRTSGSRRETSSLIQAGFPSPSPAPVQPLKADPIVGRTATQGPPSAWEDVLPTPAGAASRPALQASRQRPSSGAGWEGMYTNRKICQGRDQIYSRSAIGHTFPAGPPTRLKTP
jgi:hypothetical protein